MKIAKAAVRWLRANALKYRIRADRIGVVGFSAGAHLACLLDLAGPTAGFEGAGGSPEQSSRVQAVVSYFGPTDFSTRDWPKDPESKGIAPFLGGTFADIPADYQKASPIKYVTRDAPPFLFFHGTDDPIVPVDQSRRLAAKLKLLGIPAQLLNWRERGMDFRMSTTGNASSKCWIF